MQKIPSPNCGPRVGVAAPDMVVLHYTDMASAGEAVSWLCNPVSKVSSHYLIAADGTLVQMVDEAARAQHAGVSSWEGTVDINSRSIGIELDSFGHRPNAPTFPAEQIDALTKLLDELRARWPIPRRGVVAHSDVAPARKIDPGERFPWGLLAARGHALALDEEAVARTRAGVPKALTEGDALMVPAGLAEASRLTDDQFQLLTDALRRAGYGVVPDTDAASLPVVATAFHRRHMPWRVGTHADTETLMAAENFAALTEADRRDDHNLPRPIT